MKNYSTSYGLSGHAYVSAKMRPEATDVPDKTYRQIKIAADSNCGHEDTVCSECLGSWAIDYELYLWRTLGGRRLGEMAGADVTSHRPMPDPFNTYWPVERNI